MNVNGAFILAEISRNQEDLSASVSWPQHADISQIYLITNLGRCLSHVSHCHTPLKHYKNDQMMSKSFSAEFPRALDFEPWCREFVQCCLNTCHSCVFENITFCSLFANPFHDFNHHSNPADVFAALVLAFIWSRNVIVQYKLFGLFTYSAYTYFLHSKNWL